MFIFVFENLIIILPSFYRIRSEIFLFIFYLGRKIFLLFNFRSLIFLKGWLTSVPHEPTRAYCKYCKKDLHAHRLSLLKHMCTMKHQRSALMYQNTMGRTKNAKLEEGDMDAEYSETEENRVFVNNFPKIRIIPRNQREKIIQN